MNARGKNILLLLAALFAPAKLFACATCFGGNIDSPMADGMNWGIFALLAVIGSVLMTILGFFVYLIRRGEMPPPPNNP